MANDEVITDTDASERPAELKIKEPDSVREAKIDAQRRRLIQSLDAGDFTTTLTRVAGVLNMYPDTRNSDVQLALMYWDIYQPELFDHAGIQPKNLFKLERMTNITRARAKIQNEFNLFLATGEVRRGRKKLEQSMQEQVIENAAPRPAISVYADETGKTGEWLVVGSIWILHPKTVWDLTNAINKWRADSPFKNREIHFSRFGARDHEHLRQYLAVVAQHRQYLGVKYAAVRRSGIRRSIEDAVIKLHEVLLVDGLCHELSTGRTELPRFLNVVIDEEDSLDKFALRTAHERINATLSNSVGQKDTLEKFESLPSKLSPLIQLADVVAGAVNRKMNSAGASTNYKDEMADLVCQSLGILLDGPKEKDFDATTILYA